MNRIIFPCMLLAVTILACGDQPSRHSGESAGDSAQNRADDKSSTTVPVDSNTLFTVDDYPVTNDMLEDKNANNSSHKKRSGNVYSFDQVWFGNDQLQQTLVVGLATDKYRRAYLHFLNNDIPPDLINKTELNLENGDTASFQQKRAAFKGFVDGAEKIDQRFFTTQKDIKLGDDKQKVIGIYGSPHQVSTADNTEILEWEYASDILYDPERDKGKPVAKDSYGHQARMFFKGGKLIAMILHNDVP